MKLYAFSCCCCYGVCDLSGCASFSTRPARLLVLILNSIPIAQSPLPLPLPSSIPVPFPHHIFVIIAWSIWQIQLAIAALAQRSRYSLFLYFYFSVSPSPLPMLLFVVCLSVEFRKISTYKNISSFRFYYESPRLELPPQLSWAELSWAELSWVELSWAQLDWWIQRVWLRLWLQMPFSITRANATAQNIPTLSETGGIQCNDYV